MLPSQALLLLCHLDNDLVTIIFIAHRHIDIYFIIYYIYTAWVYVLTAHDLHLTWGHFFSHGTLVWLWPVIIVK